MASNFKPGVAFVDENFDEEEGGRAAATFHVHWEAEEGDGWKEGPAAASIDEALAWGREHASVVTVLLLDDTVYSAGDRPAQGEDGPLPPLPDAGLVIRPRPIDSPLDGSVQELSWPLIGRLRQAGITEEVRQAIEARVRADDRVDSFELIPRRHASRRRDWEVSLAITARGTTTAILAADELVSRVVFEALPGEHAGTEQVFLELSSVKG